MQLSTKRNEIEMNDNQPEALRLAHALEQGKYLLSVERDATAAELRRLHAMKADLLEALKSTERAMSNRDFALMTLCGDKSVRMTIRAAIAKAEGK
jgi:hypothetical protein